MRRLDVGACWLQSRCRYLPDRVRTLAERSEKSLRMWRQIQSHRTRTSEHAVQGCHPPAWDQACFTQEGDPGYSAPEVQRLNVAIAPGRVCRSAASPGAGCCCRC